MNLIFNNSFDFYLRRCSWEEKCCNHCTAITTRFGHVMGFFHEGKKIISFIVMPEGKDYHGAERTILAENLKLMEVS